MILILCVVACVVMGALDLAGFSGSLKKEYRDAPGRRGYQFRNGIFELVFAGMGVAYVLLDTFSVAVPMPVLAVVSVLGIGAAVLRIWNGNRFVKGLPEPSGEEKNGEE